MKKIAIVGRPNVGKSTLFNRLLRKRIAIVDRISGVTRDRLYGDMEWQGRKFEIIDTGGVDFDAKDIIKKKVLEQIRISIAEADLILFLVDVNDGIVPLDKEIDRILRQSGKNIMVVVNKVDNEKAQAGVYSFSALGWDRIIGISAAHGLNIDKLLEMILRDMPAAGGESLAMHALKVAIIGKPNVGKSTFVNSVLDESRMIVDEKPGTTRDAVDVKFKRKNNEWLFIDTAGMRRRKKVNNPLEFYGVNRAYTSIDRADIIILMIDGWDGIRSQDAQILDYIIKQDKPCVIGVNKWDLVKEVTKKEYRERIAERMAEHWYIPVVFISALKKENLDALLDKVEDLKQQSGRRVSTRDLNKLIHGLEMVRPLKIYYGTQIGVNPPSFVCFGNIMPNQMYHNYMKNLLHKAFELEIPVKVQFRAKKEKKKH